MKNVSVIIFTVVLLGLAGFTVFYLFFRTEAADVVYETSVPQVRDIIKKTVANGSVVPRQEIDIKPQVSGIVEEVYREPGELVKKGDLLAKVKIIPDMVNLNNAENRVDRARISLENAKADYDRNKKLLENEVIAAAAFQPFDLAYKNAQTELEAAENNLALIKEGVTKKMGQATNTLIRSTIDGMVLDVPIKEGNSVIEANTFNEGTTIATVADMGEMIFEGKIDESEVGKLKLGMELILTVGAIEEERFKATLEYISPKGVEENGAIQFEIKAAVELKENVMIRAGYSANADIVLSKVEQVMSVNENTLVFQNDSVYVEVLKDSATQQFDKRLVTTGLSDGIFIEVKEGVDSSVQLKVQK